MKTRAQAWELLTEWTKSESLIKHALSVEAAMKHYAKFFGEDEILWGITGLLHDFDYERHPSAEEHPKVGMAYLTENGWPEEMIDAIGGHAPYLNIPRKSRLAVTLFAVDELCGLITAVAYTRPNRKLSEVTVESVAKKMKDKSFARSVSREDIRTGCEELGLSQEEHIAHCLSAMQEIASELEL